MGTQLDHMQRAIELAGRGRGFVEPNPMVGCVIVKAADRIGEGWHQRFGGPHAEIEALRAAGDRADGATMFVTLEPCCHHGKTPPCTDAIIRAGIRRVVVAQDDPFPQVRGQGLARLQQAGIAVEVGLMRAEAERLNSPYLTRIQKKRPWIIAKWAMTLDGKIASRDGTSRWISGLTSRQRVHRLRGLMDAIIVGRGTLVHDDPQLTARPPGPRTPTRIVLDTHASISLQCQLVRSCREVPVVIAAGPDVDSDKARQLRERGCEVIVCEGTDHQQRLNWLFAELGRRQFTNILVEGGAAVLGTLFDAQLIDEVHVFVAPKLVGGRAAVTPVGGVGNSLIPENSSLIDRAVEILDQDVYISGRVTYL